MVLATCLAGAGGARAAVFEVGDDGALSVRAGSAEVAWTRPDEVETAPKVPDVAITQITAPTIPIDYQAAVSRNAELYRISPALLAALAGRESGWRAHATSARGAQGLTQLMPATARMLGVDARDPIANLAGGAHYLRTMLDRFDGDLERALAAYNAGPARVLRAGGVPAIAETRAYVATIMMRLSPTMTAANLGQTR